MNKRKCDDDDDDVPDIFYHWHAIAHYWVVHIADLVTNIPSKLCACACAHRP